MEGGKVGLSNRCCSVCYSRKGPMFHFPKKPDRREVWRQLLGLERASDSGQICAAHFRPEDLKECNGLHRLARGAQPCEQSPVPKTPRNSTNRAANPACVVPGCGMTASDGITLHLFPRFYERRIQWATLLKLEKVPSVSTLICSKHFLPSDFRISNGKKILKKTATPSPNLLVSHNSSLNNVHRNETSCSRAALPLVGHFVGVTLPATSTGTSIDVVKVYTVYTVTGKKK